MRCRGPCTIALALLALGCGSSGGDGRPTDPAPGGGAASPATGGSSPGGAPPPRGAAFDPSRPGLATNLVAVSYYSPQWPFVDAMKMSRVNPRGFPWDLRGGAPPPLDPQGYPVGLARGQSVSTTMLRGVESHFPAGEYVVLFEGEGTVTLSHRAGRATHTHDGAGTARFTLRVTPSNDGLTLSITRSNPANHVRNVRVIMPGFEATHERDPFHPLFLERLAPFTALRFMDWGQTNRSPVSRWSERKRPDHRSQHGPNGVAYEVMVDLCNRARKHMWVCVPHRADDDYVRALAALLRDRLDPDLKVFVEYSNEVWNGAFSQHRDVAAAAKREGLEWYAWYARRSAQVFDIFEDAFGGAGRLVRVLGSQAANPWIGEKILAALPEGSAADALAIAPYFGAKLGNASSWRATRALSVEQVLDACAADLARQRELVRRYKDLADAAGLALIAYEGGQHLCPVGEAGDDAALVDLFVAANRHARMRQLYLDYLAMWEAEGGGLFAHFTDVYVPQRWGCWGALEHQDSDPAGSPKYSALVEVARRWALGPAAATGAGAPSGARPTGGGGAE